MKRAILVMAASALVLAAPVQTQAQPQSAPQRRPPNIVILLADDWGFSDVGAFGSEMATPNLDWMAANGVRFSNFHVAGSCSPTRAMLQTGVGNHRAGLGNMPETIPPQHIGARGYDTVLSLNTVTIADLLRAQGYRTYLTGKWHLGKDARRIPTARGYDHAFSLADAGADNFEQRPIEGMYASAEWTEDGRAARLPANYYSSSFVVDQMIRYIEGDRASGKPFLASINFLANHIPVQAHDADIARYANMYRTGWAALRAARGTRARARGVIPANAPMGPMQSNEDWDALSAAERAAAVRVMQAYGAMGSAMDREVGRLISHLRNMGDLDNTLFVFLSDNGAEPMEPMSRWRNRQYLRWQYDMSRENIGRRNSFSSIGPSWASAAVSPLAGYKFSATEGGIRVPMVIAWPGNAAVRRGAVVSAMTHVVDIAPTLIAASGAAGHAGQWQGRAVEPMIGTSLMGALTGTAQRVRSDDEPLGYELSGNAALFRGVYKLVKNLPPIGDGRWRLFDVESDPGETRDLSASNPALFAQMQADYAAYAQRDGVLAMPDGYTFNDQINANAFENVMKPKLIRLGAWIGGVLALISALWWWRRRRRAVGVD
ncbi:MAG: sulfatase-like hydrolase/transferase [Sphingopyxis sp.]